MVTDTQANKRKLVTVRTINDLNPIEGADAIEVATVDGWKIVVKKGEFKVGDLCVYFEIDSFLPDGNPAWQFLVDRSSRIFEGAKGHKLRTIKLRGQISQGLVLQPSQVPAIDLLLNGQPEYEDTSHMDYETEFHLAAEQLAGGTALCDIDFSAALGVKKWEAALPACLQGQAEGLFPSFLRKTDQERCQNMAAEIFGYEDTLEPFDASTLSDEALEAMYGSGILHWVGDGLGGKCMKLRRAKADRDARYEVTMKLDGSSMTAFARAKFTEPLETEDGIQNPIEVGVCSRNLQLKINDENADNTFVKMAVGTGLLRALETLASDGVELAVQGELMGPNIQGNREQLGSHAFYVFDIFDICDGRYLAPEERRAMFDRLTDLGANIKHVPIIAYSANLLDTLGLKSVEDLLAFAEGPSIKHPIREGLVFKRMDGQFSFKAISNRFLEKEKD